ncbi:MAG: MoxR family ATPase [Candidatus Sericytochromatia bacterium]|nr:MoxR family ATPase [Candidatus Sericytochromatia bacterium]
MSQPDCQALLARLNEAVIGKPEPIRLVVAALLAGGHVLLEDVPGVGKTLLARTLAGALGGDWKRVQCSPDLLPGDITGVNVFHPGSGEFRFVPGPLFAHVVLVDEVNRASPRTQASLLEAMEEGHVTLEGVTRDLPRPFLVIATQNPVEHHGTFPLPEAQLDRFALAVSLGYPTPAEELRLLQREAAPAPLAEPPVPLLAPDRLLAWQADVRGVTLDESLQRWIVEVAARSRQPGQAALGISPRGSLVWQRVAQALAWLDGRGFVTPDDVVRAAGPVLAHRLVLAGRQGSAARRERVESLLRELALPD